MATPALRPVSQRYLKLFNELGKEGGITWKGDADGNGLPDPEEVTLTPQFKNTTGWKKLDAEGRQARLHLLGLSLFRRMGERRATALAEALNEKYLKPYRFEWAPHELPEPIQQALPKFHEISDLTEELRLLQLDSSGARLWEQTARGDANSLKLFERGYEGGCHRYIENPFCDSVPSFPDLDPNSVMWPNDLIEADLAKLAGHPQEAMLMSPFTVVENMPDQEKVPMSKRVFWIQEYNRHPLLRERLVMIAKLFEEIAAIPGFAELEPDTAATAKAYAAAIREGRGPAFFDNAEITWAKARGRRIAFTWGPFEESQDPFGKKRTFQFHLFLVRQKEEAEMDKYQKAVLQEMENRLAERVPGYLARDVSVPSVIQVYDVIERSGGMNSPHSEYLAEVIPNTGPVNDGGYRKKQIFANLNEGTYEHVLRHLALEGLWPGGAAYVGARFLTLNSTLHELSHSIGPLKDSSVSRNGKAVPADLAMGAALFDGIEEAKADVGGIWMYSLLVKKGLLTEEEACRGYVTYVASLMRSLRFGSQSPHGRGAKAQFGYLFKTGAIEIQQEPITFLEIHVEKIPQAVEAMVVEIAKAQYLGSTELAKQFFAHANHIPETWNTGLVPRFEAIPRHIKLEVKEEEPPPAAMRAQETDAERGPQGNSGFNCGCNLGARP